MAIAGSAAAAGIGEPCSPSVSINSLASVTEDGDAEHIAAKYREMKASHRAIEYHPHHIKFFTTKEVIFDIVGGNF